MDLAHSDAVTSAPTEPTLPPYSLSYEVSQDNEVEVAPPQYSQSNGSGTLSVAKETSYREIIEACLAQTCEHGNAGSNGITVHLGCGRYNHENLAKLERAFFDAIEKGDCEAVTRVIDSGLQNAKTIYADVRCDASPLIMAVKNHDRGMARCLILQGYYVNEIGVARLETYHNKPKFWTPLQVAASLGDLPMVKLLMEEFHADPTIITNDGQHALRLAADAGHSHVVQYLPIVRGGAFRRLKVRCRKPLSILQKTCYVVGEVTKAITYTCPKWLFIHCVYRPLLDLSKLIWRGLKAMPSFLYRQAKLAPERFRRFCIWIKEQIVKIPGYIKRVCVWIYQQIKKTPERFIRVAKAMPKICRWMKNLILKILNITFECIKLTAKAISTAATRIATALLNILQRTISLLHTIFSAVLSFFRNLTLSNIYDGLTDVLRAIFITFPQTLANVFGRFWKVFMYLMDKMFSIVGIFIACLIWITWEIVTFIPKQMWQMIIAIGQLILGIGREIRIWWNPKAGVEPLES